jgi:CheY-like chemotaxis protein
MASFPGLIARSLTRTTDLQGSELILPAEDDESGEKWRERRSLFLAEFCQRQTAKRYCVYVRRKRHRWPILDVVMPHMGGAATAVELLGRFPGLPILFTSGYSESTESSVSQIPVSCYLQKPYSPTSLGRSMQKILDESPQRS